MVIHRSVTRKQVATPAQLRQIEAEANAFASAFLLPASSFAEDLYTPTLDGMRMLKPKWKTSIAAMVHRASDLGIVSESHARRLWINRSNRKWNRWEPGDDLLPLGEPTILPQAFEIVIESGAQSAGQLFDSIPYSRDDIRKLASLPDDFLGDAPSAIRLRPKTNAPTERIGGGSVVPFERRN